MKTIALVLFATFACTANATVHVVTCQNGNSHFLPITVNATVGDTIHWTWVSGTHVVGPIYETDIPVGADTWNGWINQNLLTYDYVVTVPGDYHYVCHPASPHGEDGYIVVSEGAAQVAPETRNTGTLLSPNPFTEQLAVQTTGASSMILYNALGDQVGAFALTRGSSTLRLDTGTLPNGMYFCSILRDGVVLETLRVVRQ